MPWTEQARLLLRKARQDAVIVEIGGRDEGISDEIIGFHVQQACEKCIKAALSAHGIAYRRTHDLQELYDLLVDSNISVDPAMLELVDWSPFAVSYRYEDWLEPDPIDRTRAIQLTEAAIGWASAVISSPPAA